MKVMTNHERFAGSWYPQDPRELVALFGAPGEAARQSANAPVLAVLPHAGLTFSGAGQGAFWYRWFERIQRDPPWDLVVIVSPSHYRHVPEGQIVGAPFTEFATPLGPLPGAPVNLGDREDAPLLEGEHGIELLLPGVRHFLGESVPVAAVITGPLPTTESARAAAQRLLQRLPDRRVLWLVSSDFTHYGARFGYTPYGASADPAIREAVQQDDLRVARGIAGGELPGYYAVLGQRSTVCGRYAAALALGCLEGSDGWSARGSATGSTGNGAVLGWYTSPWPAASFVCYATVEVCK